MYMYMYMYMCIYIYIYIYIAIYISLHKVSADAWEVRLLFGSLSAGAALDK